MTTVPFSALSASPRTPFAWDAGQDPARRDTFEYFNYPEGFSIGFVPGLKMRPAEPVDWSKFYGTLGTQTSMPFGTPKDVRDTVFRNLTIAGPAGGLFCRPTHLLEPGVPWANIEAYVAACKEFKS